MTISLCMIVRNEEKMLARCLASVKELVSEIIIVDTGSEDRTKEIAQGFKAKILTWPWDNDFAAPRNLSLQHATCEWILVLDADELIAPRDHLKLKKLIQNRKNCYEFLQRHYTSDFQLSGFKPVTKEYPELEEGEPGYFESNCVRLFPNGEGLYFVGKVHELVEPSIASLGRHQVVRTEVPIHHYGHTTAVKSQKQKSRTYTTLGQAKVKEAPNSWKNHFELGVEHNNNRLYEEAVTEFLSAIALNPRYMPSWCNIGYALCELEKYDEARQALQTAIELESDSDEAYCNLGLVELRCKKYELAARCFLKALELNPRYVVAYTNLGNAMWMQNDPERAVQCFRNALTIMPQCVTALVDLGTILYSLQKFEEAKELLQRALALDKTVGRAHYYLAQILKVNSQIKEALYHFEAFCNSASVLDPAFEPLLKAARLECEELRDSLA